MQSYGERESHPARGLGVCGRGRPGRMTDQSAEVKRRALPISILRGGFIPGAIYELVYIAQRSFGAGPWASRRCGIWSRSSATNQKRRGRQRQPLVGDGTGVEEGLCLGPVPKRPVPAGSGLPGLQRGRARPASVRRHRAPRLGRRAHVPELRVRAARHLLPAAHQPARARAIPVRLQRPGGPPDGPEGRHPQAACHGSPGDPYPDLHRVLAEAGVIGPH